MNPQARGRLKLLVIFVVFSAPVVAAVLLYLNPEWRPQGRVNHGTLIEPVRLAPSLSLVDAAGAAAPTALRGKWSLVQLGGEDCGQSCRDRLALSRQVRLALNQNRDRVQRLYIAPSRPALSRARDALGAEHPDLVWLADEGPAGARASDFFRSGDREALYLVDPLGHWLMVYQGSVEPKGLHRDLKKLLRFSQVG